MHQPKSPPHDDERNQAQVPLRRGTLDSVTVYEVTDDELTSLEKGSPASLSLNLAIALLTLAITFSVTLATANISGRGFYAIVFLTVVGYVNGAICLLQWFWRRSKSGGVIQRIRGRLVEPP